MAAIVLEAISIFFVIMEILLLIDLFLVMFHIRTLKRLLSIVLDPLLHPIRYFLKHSVLQTPMMDLSPIIAILVLTYLGQLIN